MSARKNKFGTPVGDPACRYVCEPCLRGSGWQRVYQHTPFDGNDSSGGRRCGNCDRPECVTRWQREHGNDMKRRTGHDPADLQAHDLINELLDEAETLH